MRLAVPLHALQPYADLPVHGTAHPTSTATVRPRSAAVNLIRSAVDISHPRHQGNTCADMPAASGLVRSDIINGLDVGEGADNVVASALDDDAFDGRDNRGRNLGDVSSNVLA